MTQDDLELLLTDLCDRRKSSEDGFNTIFSSKLNDITPATKKQCGLLLGGYEWDSEMKELKKTNLNKVEPGKYYFCIKDYFSGGKKFASKGDIVQALRGLPIMGLEDISEHFMPVNNVHSHAWSEDDEIGEWSPQRKNERKIKL